MALKAVQQIMLGSVTGTREDAEATLKRIKAAGYDGLELNGFMIRPTSWKVRMLTKLAGMPTGKGGNLDWAALLSEAGLDCVSIHEDLGTIERDMQDVVREAHRFNTDMVVITGMYRFDYSSRDSVLGLCSRLNSAGSKLKREGISLLYHNHNCELRRVEGGMTAFDLMIKETDSDCVNFEYDSYWPAEAGADTTGLMCKLGDRMRLYHINDRGTRLTGSSMTPILKSDSMELGTGNMNLLVLIEQALSVNAAAVILESHKNWIDKSPVRSLEVSAEFMNKYIH